MAQTNFTPILLYASSTPTSVPSASNLTNSATGSEIAINVADKNLFFKDSTNAVNTVPIRQSSTSSNGWLSSTDWNTFNSKAPSVTFTSNYIPFGQGTTTLNQSAALTFDGTNLSVAGFLKLGSSPSTASGQVVRINEVFTASYAAGNTATSSTTLTNGVWSLFTQTQSSANGATYGLYLIHRMGTSTAVSTVTNDAGVTISVNGSYKVVITNASGGSRTLQGNLSLQLGQAL